MFSLSACLGYRAADGEHSPGYSEISAGPGVFVVRYNAPGASDQRTLYRRVERRASALCPRGYSLTGLQYDSEELMHSLRTKYNFATARVSCHE